MKINNKFLCFTFVYLFRTFTGKGAELTKPTDDDQKAEKTAETEVAPISFGQMVNEHLHIF